MRPTPGDKNLQDTMQPACPLDLRRATHREPALLHRNAMPLLTMPGGGLEIANWRLGFIPRLNASTHRLKPGSFDNLYFRF